MTTVEICVYASSSSISGSRPSLVEKFGDALHSSMVRESYDSDSSTSRLSSASVTRNDNLERLSDGAALKPLLPHQGGRHLAAAGR